MLFQVEGVRYKHVCLQPRIFTNFLKPVMATLQKLGDRAMNYLDDFILVGNNFEECLKELKDATDLSPNLSSQINLEKLVLYTCTMN